MTAPMPRTPTDDAWRSHQRTLTVVGIALAILAWLGATAVALLFLGMSGVYFSLCHDAPDDTPLHQAVTANDLATVRTLLPKASHETIEHEFFYVRSAEAVELFIASGATVTARNGSGYTPLHFAAAVGIPAVVETLLRHGADVNAIDPGGGDTPLMLGVWNFTGDPDQGFDTTGCNKTIADIRAVARILLAHGANVNLRNGGGFTPLMRAAETDTELVQLLLDAHADATARATQGDTTLHSAARSGTAETIRLLLAHGADPSVKEWQGFRPIDLVYGTSPEAEEKRRLLKRP